MEVILLRFSTAISRILRQALVLHLQIAVAKSVPISIRYIFLAVCIDFHALLISVSGTYCLKSEGVGS